MTKTKLTKLLCSYLKVSVPGYYKHLNYQNLITTQKTENAQIEEYTIHTQEK